MDALRRNICLLHLKLDVIKRYVELILNTNYAVAGRDFFNQANSQTDKKFQFFILYIYLFIYWMHRRIVQYLQYITNSWDKKRITSISQAQCYRKKCNCFILNFSRGSYCELHFIFKKHLENIKNCSKNFSVFEQLSCKVHQNTP